MMENVISATEARNRWFEILNLVYFKGESVIIEKNKTPMVRLTAVSKPNIMSIDKFIRKTYGFLKNTKTYWPCEDLKVRKKEIAEADRFRSWK